jgi:hypothetical protein
VLITGRDLSQALTFLDQISFQILLVHSNGMFLLLFPDIAGPMLHNVWDKISWTDMIRPLMPGASFLSNALYSYIAEGTVSPSEPLFDFFIRIGSIERPSSGHVE